MTLRSIALFVAFPSLLACGSSDDSGKPGTGGAGSGGGGVGATAGSGGSGANTTGGAGGSGAASGGGSSGSAGSSSCASPTPSITSLGGTVADGSTITISGCGFGAKSRAAPHVWDVTSEQWVAGQNKDAYASLSDGDEVNTGVWQLIVANAGQTARLTTSRPHRHARVVSHYTDDGIKLTLGNPWQPDGSANPPSTQRRFYLSYYRKVKLPSDTPGGGDGSTKLLRVDTPTGALTGVSFTAHGSTETPNTSSEGHVTSWIDVGPETTWVRWEFYVDLDKKWYDVWKNGHYHLGSWSTFNGTVEIRPAADWRFRTGMEGCQFDPPLPAGEPILPALFGYDDGHDVSTGQEIDMSEIYFDDTQARVEISDQPSWDDTPTSSAAREVQGRLESWSESSITLRLYQGGFDSLSGKYLYVIDQNGVVNSSGFPL